MGRQYYKVINSSEIIMCQLTFWETNILIVRRRKQYKVIVRRNHLIDKLSLSKRRGLISICTKTYYKKILWEVR